MARVCCLAGIDRRLTATFSTAFSDAGSVVDVTFARLDVTDLGKLVPDYLVCDVDSVDVDRLELLRRIRFVLPDCLIAVYTGILKRGWSVDCHLAGANCMLTTDSDPARLAAGLRGMMRSGCYTDPRFAAA